MNQDYVRKQVNVYVSAKSEDVADDAIFRIASHCDLIPPSITNARQMGHARMFEVLAWLDCNGFLAVVEESSHASL